MPESKYHGGLKLQELLKVLEKIMYNRLREMMEINILDLNQGEEQLLLLSC